MSVAKFGQPFVTTVLDSHELGDEVYVGLFVCSLNADVIEKAVFKNVRMTVPAARDFVPYRDFIGCRLETLDVHSGERWVLMETADRIAAPNWHPDGTHLIYDSEGLLYRFDLNDKKSELLDTGFANPNNHDHVLSFDGKFLGISHSPPKLNGEPRSSGGSVVYTLPAAGAEPKRVTDKAPSYLHGWSPNGDFLIYTAKRKGQFDIYRISVNGGEETQLTNTKQLDDGSEYSTDGKYIYFNSARTGTMKWWRMKPDGSDQKQLTDDELNDWFPHVSPIGNHIVFLSFPSHVAAGDHPFYKRVYLRMMPVEGGESKVIGYVYGGQGSINVPSWSPDSRTIAFVGNTGEQEK